MGFALTPSALAARAEAVKPRHCTVSEQTSRPTLSPCRTCKVSTISPESRVKRNLPNFSPQSSTCQPAGGHGEHWNLPWSHGNKLPVWFPSSQCCTTAVQFSFFLTKFSVEEPVKQLVELSSTNWFQFLYGCDICKRTMLQVTINQVITKYLSIKNANLYKNIHRDTTTKSVAAHDI